VPGVGRLLFDDRGFRLTREWRTSVAAKLGDTNDASIDNDAETGAQRGFDVANDLLRVILGAGKDVNFRETTSFVRDSTGGHDATEGREQTLCAYFNGRYCHVAQI
jgi:hypothetical protein